MSAEKSGLFIDLDGTLADSLGEMNNVYYKFLGQFGKFGNNPEFESLNGMPLSRVVSVLAKNHSLNSSNSDLLKSYHALVKASYLNVAPRRGALGLLKQARALNMTIVIVTSNNSTLARDWALSKGLDSYIDDVVGDEDVFEGKPNPEPYLLALSRNNCNLRGSIALEDSFKGAKSAISAGLKTFLIDSTRLEETNGLISRVVDVYAVTKFLRENAI